MGNNAAARASALSSSAPCWVITDAAAGNQRQALALAGALGLEHRHLVLTARPPWSWLSPRLTLAGRLALSGEQQAMFAPPWPQVAIGCGRAAALFTRMLRPLSGGRCFTTQILDPRIDPSHWDTLIAPQHDEPLGLKVIRPLGSLHPIDDAWLADARAAFVHLADLPQPRVGVLLGGPRKGVVIDRIYATRLAERLRARHRDEGGSVLVVGSARTPVEVITVLREALAGVPGLCWSNSADGANPYPGVMAWADRLVVTPDSVNMLSEACAVGCPVHTFVIAAPPPKIARFHQSLRRAGLLHNIDAKVDAQRGAPLRETASVAAILRQRIATHEALRR